MPAQIGLEGHTYPLSIIKGRYPESRAQLQVALHDAGGDAMAYVNSVDSTISAHAPVEQYVNREILVVKDGLTSNGDGNWKPVTNQVVVSVTPKHAHGGYSYSPVAERFAQSMQAHLGAGATLDTHG